MTNPLDQTLRPHRTRLASAHRSPKDPPAEDPAGADLLTPFDAVDEEEHDGEDRASGDDDFGIDLDAQRGPDVAAASDAPAHMDLSGLLDVPEDGEAVEGGERSGEGAEHAGDPVGGDGHELLSAVVEESGAEEAREVVDDEGWARDINVGDIIVGEEEPSEEGDAAEGHVDWAPPPVGGSVEVPDAECAWSTATHPGLVGTFLWTEPEMVWVVGNEVAGVARRPLPRPSAASLEVRRGLAPPRPVACAVRLAGELLCATAVGGVLRRTRAGSFREEGGLHRRLGLPESAAVRWRLFGEVADSPWALASDGQRFGVLGTGCRLSSAAAADLARARLGACAGRWLVRCRGEGELSVSSDAGAHYRSLPPCGAVSALTLQASEVLPPVLWLAVTGDRGRVRFVRMPLASGEPRCVAGIDAEALEEEPGASALHWDERLRALWATGSFGLALVQEPEPPDSLRASRAAT